MCNNKKLTQIFVDFVLLHMLTLIQGSIYSIYVFRINPHDDFQMKNSKFSYFRFNTHSYFPESGSGKRFQASGMHAIDSSHKIRPNRVIFEKNFGSKK